MVHIVVLLPRRGCLKSPLRGIKCFLPHPNPPRLLGRELDFPVSPQHIGGIKGGKNAIDISEKECRDVAMLRLYNGCG
jgi:hypothetical protein